ncbi:hypothetical protein Tco_0805887, partial [Tanacetum coccineum]
MMLTSTTTTTTTAAAVLSRICPASSSQLPFTSSSYLFSTNLSFQQIEGYSVRLN